MRRFLVAAALLAVLGSAPASAHDDAKWIMENYRYCCGPKDCSAVPGRVYWKGKGWRVRGIEGYITAEEVKLSPNNSPWACRNLKHNTLRCLFLPAPGFM